VDVALPPGTEFFVPEISSALPLEFHADVARIDERCAAWARPRLTAYFGKAALAERYIRQRMPRWACACYPHMGVDWEFALPNMMIPSGIADDAFSRPGIQESVRAATALRDRYFGVLDGHPAGDDFPAGRMLGEALDLATPRMAPTVAERYRDAYRSIFHSAVQEAERRNGDNLPDFATYMRGRRTNLFGYWATIQTEFALGIDLTRELDENQDLALARDLTIDHMILVNDLYSFPKEHDAGETMNAVWILVARQGRALQEAIDRLAQLIGETEAAFTAARRRIARGDLAGRADVSRYVTELGHLITGNIYYHERTTRYHGDDHDGRRVASTRVAMVRRPTVHS
jgi:hypothetical protein